MMKTDIPFARNGKNNKLKLHEAVGMTMDCRQFQEYQEKQFCDYLRTNENRDFSLFHSNRHLALDGIRRSGDHKQGS